MDQAMNAYFASMTKQFNNPTYSDVVVSCDGSTFYVHKVVLCSQSPVFDAMMKQDMLEKALAKIEIEDQKPEVVKAFLEFLYSRTYTCPSDGQSKSCALPFHAHVDALGHLYRVLELQQTAGKLFTELTKATLEEEAFRENFWLSVRCTYLTTPSQNRAFRDTLADMVVQDVGRRESLLQGLLAMLETFPEFASDVAARFLTHPPPSPYIELRCRNYEHGACFIQKSSVPHAKERAPYCLVCGAEFKETGG
ncbi:MAG: hypothetical protein M1828_001307 [Chrysothrix sp. TS-e1954]|nr:MAG: hypothetical protein M1828_001307 [Chrysothrix sp. TS-e1954]